uniref:Uncharacterized protein n=1 Tax=Tanacetum cinerariifolium TaxID=118510 RepID=A0A6L2KTL8_TANCI|nr:hypothetical protein [Tanacetum cinerariifolium]
MGDSTGVSVSLGEISLEGNKYWESNICDSDNTGDEGKIAGRAITTWGGRMASYACMTYIFESLCKGKKTSMSKRYLVKLFEVSGETFPGKITVVILVRDKCPRGKDFVPIGSEEDERRIRDMNKKAEEESSDKGVDNTKKRKAGSRMKRMSKRQKTDVDLVEEEKLNFFLKIVPDEEGIIDYEVLDKRFLIIIWESKFYHYDRHGAKGIYYRIFKSDGCSRWIKTFFEIVTRFDRLDLVELYNLVMKIFKTTTPEGVDIILCGDLRIMFEANAEDELWQNQEEWSLKKKRYPLTTKTLERMLSLSLIVESASDVAYDLLRFIQKHIDEFRGYDRGENDL